MRRLDLLITTSRRSTENLDFTEDAGIQDVEFIQYFNDGQDAVHALILNLFPDMYQKEVLLDVTQGLETYDIPSDAYIGQRVEMVEYSRSGRTEDYYPLKKGNKRERLSGASGNPSFYIRRSSQILIEPKPETGGKLRVTYQRAIPTLDIRRGTVVSVTLGVNTVTNLTLDTSELIDSDAIAECDYICVVDKYGTIKMKGIAITGIDATTGIISIDPDFEFEDGETIEVGDFVVCGKYATTHSELPDPTEKYLLEYTNTRIEMRDSSNDSQELAALLNRFEGQLQITFAEPDGDVNMVTILDTQYLGTGDY